MTTATLEKETPAPATTDSPKKPIGDYASVFYGTESASKADTQEDSQTSTPATSETGSAATSEKTPAASTETAKVDDSAKGTAETKESTKESTNEGKGDGHQAAARRLGNEVKELSSKLNALVDENAVLRAKIDGTYQEPAKPTPEQIRDQAEFLGREKASRVEAERVHGATVVKEQIYDPGSAYEVLVKAKPWLQARVMRHPQPTVEAMRVLAEESFIAKYGDDPTQWASKLEAELKPKLLDEFKQQAQLPPIGKEPPTVSETRGSGGGSTKERSMVDIFYGKGHA